MESSVVTDSVPDSVPTVEVPDFTFDATTGPGHAQPTASDRSGGGDGSAVSCPWSLSHEQQVRNLKVNWARALYWAGVAVNFEQHFECHPLLERVVSQLRANPCLDSCEIEIEKRILGSLARGPKMTSLHLAILMGDLKMVQEILQRGSIPDHVIRGHYTISKVDIYYTPLHLAVAGGDSNIVASLLEKGADVNVQNRSLDAPLDLAYQMKNQIVLQQLLVEHRASCPWSLTHKHQVKNLKVNWTRALQWAGVVFNFEQHFECHPLLERVVSQLRANPCLDSYKIEIEKRILGSLAPEPKMTSLHLAILMGDLKMVQEILQRGSVPDHVICGYDTHSKADDIHSKTDIYYTPLHLAVAGGDSNIVSTLLKKGADVNAPNQRHVTPLDLACEMGNVPMLQQLLKGDTEKKDLLHVAVRRGNIDFMKKLPYLKVNAVDYQQKTPMHYLATDRFYDFHVKNIVRYLAQEKAIDMKALDRFNLSAFYVAILDCNTNFVIAILDFLKDQVRVNEACLPDRGPPIQIAFEGGEPFKDIRSALMECEPVKGYLDKLFRDRQVYVDAANAILVGAALIASVTFASWLQPPLSYTSYSGEGYSSSSLAPSTSNLNYVDVEHNTALRAFWVFNALSFYFAIATVVCGARSVLPRSHLFIEKTVEKLRTNLLVTSVLLACSVLFVIIAFAIAGTIVLTPLVKYQWCMIVPTIVGGIVCIISLGFLFKGMRENYTNTLDNGEVLTKKDRDYLKECGYKISAKARI